MRAAAETWMFRAFGLTISVTVPDPGVERLLRDQLPAFPAPPARARVDRRYTVAPRDSGFRISVDGRRPGAVRGAHGTANRIVADLQTFLARTASGRVFVHAGVVVIQGRAVVVPGRSFSGKSTLVSSFAGAGAAYASDEFAVLDGSGRVHPYARPLALRVPGGVRLAGAAELRGGEVRRPAPVGLVLLSFHRPGARWTPQPLTPARALLELLRHTVAVRSRPAEVLSILRAVADHVPVLAGVRGAATEVVEWAMAALSAAGARGGRPES